MTADDRDLRERFAALRRQQEAQAPEFAAPQLSSARPVRPRSPAALIAVAACLLAIAAVGLWISTVSHRLEPRQGKPVASLMEWKPPTAFLLQTPGRELLRTVPEIGALKNGLPAPLPDRRNLPVGQPVLP
jgi:hypothetical protein